MTDPTRQQLEAHYATALSLIHTLREQVEALKAALVSAREAVAQVEGDSFATDIFGAAKAERPVDHRVPDVGPNTLQGAFLNGAKWWEFQSTGGTMWASDRDKAWVEAERRYPAGAMPRALREATVRRLRLTKYWIDAHGEVPFPEDFKGVIDDVLDLLTDDQTVGFEACWKIQDGFEDRHCRKPKDHEGDCAFF